MCTNDKCPMFQVHNIANEAAFSWVTLEGSYQCSKYLQYSERQWCGALKELLNGIVTPSYSLFGIRVSIYAF